MRKRAPQLGEPEENGAGQDRQFITSLHRGLEVLRAFRPDDRAGLSNSDLADRTGLPNSTVSRLTFTLLKTGYLTYDRETGRYHMGVPVLSLGYACLSAMPISETAQSYMQELADSCGEGILVALGGRDNRTMTYLACARTRSVIQLQLGVGSRISLARSAMGRAWLAACPAEERKLILQDLRRHSPKDTWPMIAKGIEEAAQQIAERGFYANIGEWQPNIHAVAVPLRRRDPSAPLLALNLGGPSAYLPKDRLIGEFGPKLVELAQALRQTSADRD